MIDWQNLVVAPCVNVFGQPAQITYGAQVFPVTGVFDEAFSQTDVVDGMAVTTVRPCLGIDVSQVNLGGAPLSSLQDSRVLVYASPYPGGAPAADTEYVVQEARADGHGHALLILNLAPTAADEPVGGGQDA